MSFLDGAGTDPAHGIGSPEFLRQGTRILRLPVPLYPGFYRLDGAVKNVHTMNMCAFTRKSVRFSDIGRIDAPQICALPGVLDDISRDGCRIHYTFPLVVDLENDYELKITPASSPMRPFRLLCHPQWVNEDKGMTEIGFSFLRSPDYSRLIEYVNNLDFNAESQDVDKQIINFVCQFV
jgi:hypothetical protein